MSVNRAQEALSAWLDSAPKPSPAHPLVAVAQELAEALDRTTSARDIAGIARELRAVLGELSAIVAAAPNPDSPLDQIRRRRESRQQGWVESPLRRGVPNGV